ncbi:MAG: hypothetical protein RLZZ234_644 [Candidatus Parcubacteria bacterium]|jgi:hypothetical protein
MSAGHGGGSAASSSSGGGKFNIFVVGFIGLCLFLGIQKVATSSWWSSESEDTPSIDTPMAKRPDGSIFMGTITIKGDGAETDVRGLEGYCLHRGRNGELVKNVNTEKRNKRYIFRYKTKGANDVEVDFISYPEGHKKCL